MINPKPYGREIDTTFQTAVMINRDGHTISLWQGTTTPFESKSRPDNLQLYDVAIAGGGITGITTALQLQRSGKRCIVLEAETLCFGTTGGTTAHLNTLLDTPYTTITRNFSKEDAKLVAAVTGRAIRLVKENIDELDIDCGFEYQDAFLYAQDDKQKDELEDIIKASRDAGLEIIEDDTVPFDVDFIKSIRVKGQAKFHPTRYVHALAEAFESLGGTIVQQCRVTDVDDADKVTLTTSRGEFQAHSLIYATHIPPGINLLHLRCAPYRSYAMAVKLSGDRYPDGLSYDMYDPYHYYRTQLVDDQPYLIVGGYDHKTGHEENTTRSFAQLEAHVRGLFNVEKIAHQWSSQYYEPADGLPYIGSLPGHTGNIYVASGFGGNGITYSHVAAMVLTDILNNVDTPYQKLFNPNRIKPVAGFTSFISHNADVIKEFVGQWFSGDKIEGLADMARGEGKLVTLEGKKIALYKDEEGQLHAVNPTCTHMKCAVAWNSGERTWDCPCHGARYSIDGKVITGPASRDLELVSISKLVEG